MHSNCKTVMKSNSTSTWLALPCHGSQRRPRYGAAMAVLRPCSDASGPRRPMIHLATMGSSRHPAPSLALAVLAALLAQAAAMAQPPARIDVSKLGPQVGERVPDFTLKDQNGKTWTLQSIMGPKGAMIVFYRSADW